MASPTPFIPRPYFPPSADCRPYCTTEGAFRRRAQFLATLAASLIRKDERGNPYLLGGKFEDEIMHALREAHAAGMIEASDAIEKREA